MTEKCSLQQGQAVVNVTKCLAKCPCSGSYIDSSTGRLVAKCSCSCHNLESRFDTENSKTTSVKGDLIRHKAPTAGQSLERPGQPVGRKSIHRGSTDG